MNPSREIIHPRVLTIHTPNSPIAASCRWSELSSPFASLAVRGFIAFRCRVPQTDAVMDSVANELSSLISSVTTSFDSRAEATSRSQEELAFALDRLTGELDKLLEDAPSPFIMQHAKRISGVRKRVTSLNSVLKSIQCRIDNMDRMLSAASSQAVTEQSVREKAIEH